MPMMSSTMFNFPFKLKLERAPSLSRDVIPGMQAMINSLSEGMIDLNKRTEQLAKDLEATRRKVYRDIKAESELPTELENPDHSVINNRSNGGVHQYRTGDPISV